jgi:TldD protein
MIAILKDQLARFGAGDYGELRYHKRLASSIVVRKGELDTAQSSRYDGVGVRVLRNGRWGFSSTNRVDEDAVGRALEQALAAAAAAERPEREVRLAPVESATGTFSTTTVRSLDETTLQDKVDLVRRTESLIRSTSQLIESAVCRFEEILDYKVIVTTDGAAVELWDSKPQFYATAVAARNGERERATEAVGVTGGLDQLFSKRSPEEMAERAAGRAVDSLAAPHPEGATTTVILGPELVGLIAHEAVGHTVEADLVQAGAVTRDKMGKRVASELVTLGDSGPSYLSPHAGGTVLVDDEGVPCGNTVIIKDGRLISYLHNRQTAAEFGVDPTGNARAWEYSVEPLIRMRNTYIAPGERSLEEMTSEVEDGYLLGAALGGQADSTAEFMFGVQEARRIRNGRLGGLVRGVTIAGQAFEVLMSVDAVSADFAWDMGSGHCGKGQPAKVDGGGPHIRCRATVGGRQT